MVGLGMIPYRRVWMPPLGGYSRKGKPLSQKDKKLAHSRLVLLQQTDSNGVRWTKAAPQLLLVGLPILRLLVLDRPVQTWPQAK
jgi:hypothetical protein